MAEMMARTLDDHRYDGGHVETMRGDDWMARVQVIRDGTCPWFSRM